MLIQLAATALVVALLPLSIVWVSRDQQKYRKLAWITMFFTLDLIMFGAFTRLTDSGLGCPDWPGCYGHADPVQAHAHIRAAETAMPTGPVTMVKAWIEMIHRYLAMAIGVLIIALMVLAIRNWLRSRRSDFRFAPALPVALFLLVCLQGAFGAWTVTLKLQPIIVTIHLLLGLSLLGMVTWLYCRHRAAVPNAPVSGRLWIPALAALCILIVQIALGGWVSTNYAVLACQDFPRCHGEWLPPMDFANGFTLWRHLGKTATGDFLSFPALTAIHWTHRNFAFIVYLFVGWVAWRAWHRAELHALGRWILIVLTVQLATGIATIFLKWPLAIAVLHNGGAALLVLLLVMLNYRAKFPSDAVAGKHIVASTCN